MHSLKHLRKGAQNTPLQLRLQWKHVCPWDKNVFGIRTIKLTAHSAHHCRYSLTRFQTSVRCVNYLANTLDAEDAWERY